MSEASFGMQCSAEIEEGVADELELLQNIYLDELQVNCLESGMVGLDIHVTPSTAGDQNKKHLYLDLHLALGKKYPQEPAITTIHASRGLSDPRLKEISLCLVEKAGELQGCPMVYELVECAKDSLTEHNLPCGRCPVCLHVFQDGDDYTSTNCYHHFHVLCLARYMQFSEAEQQWLQEHPEDGGGVSKRGLQCPVCRELLGAGSPCLAAVAKATPLLHDAKEDEEIFISPEIRLWQEEMATLLLQQQHRGGQIDIDARDQVIDETWVRPSLHSTTTSTSTSHVPVRVERKDRGIPVISSSRRKNNNTNRGGMRRRNTGDAHQSSRGRRKRREGDAQKSTREDGNIQLTSRERRRRMDDGDSKQARRRENGDIQLTCTERRIVDGGDTLQARRQDGDAQLSRRKEGDSQTSIELRRRVCDGDAQLSRREEGDSQTSSELRRRVCDGDAQLSRREEGDSQTSSELSRRVCDGDAQLSRREGDNQTSIERRRGGCGGDAQLSKRKDGDIQISKERRSVCDGNAQLSRRKDGDIQTSRERRRRECDGDALHARWRKNGDSDVQKSTREDGDIQLTSMERRGVDGRDTQKARREDGDAQLSRREEGDIQTSRERWRRVCDGDAQLSRRKDGDIQTSRERRRSVCDGDAQQARQREKSESMKSRRDDGDTQLSSRERRMDDGDVNQASHGGPVSCQQISMAGSEERMRENIRQASSGGRRVREYKESHQYKSSSKCGKTKKTGNSHHARCRILRQKEVEYTKAQDIETERRSSIYPDPGR